LRASAACWSDAVWAIVVDAPHEALEKAEHQMTLQAARANPDRETWGATPEQQALMNRAKTMGGNHAPPPAGRPPSIKRGNGRPI